MTSRVSTRTPSGVRYNVEVYTRGGRECTYQLFSALAPHIKPFQQRTHSCGPSNRPPGPTLVQFATPRAAFIVDRPARGCGPVRISTPRMPITDAQILCSTGKPTLRVTILPRASRLTITGIHGIPQLLLRDYRCAFVCVRALAAAAR
jgi:hypothetical protein